MPKTVGNALWGGKDGGSRRAIVASLAAIVVALVTPTAIRAADIPASLLSQAQANPGQSFGVIIQTAPTPTTTGAINPATDALLAITGQPQKALEDATRASDQAAKTLNDLAQKAADAGRRADDAQRRADAAAAKAAQSGKPDDQAAAAKAQADAAKARADAQAAQGAVAGAQAAATTAMLQAVQTQAVYLNALGQAQSEIQAQYSIIPAVKASVTGTQILAMAQNDDAVAVTLDTPVALTGDSNSQKWVDAVTAHAFWGSPQRKLAGWRLPTIAVVDSGVDPSRVQDFGGRLLGQVNITSLQPNSPGDGRGHGTMVASIAAGGADRHTGVEPDAPLISLDVINDNGEGLTSDVIAAADWILQNKNTYNIRVANFSLEGSTDSSFMFDPLSKAVEQLWFNGVVVVAAAGNYSLNGAASGIHYAPASDPFVITVGALDIGKDGNPNDDKAAPWSSWGYTSDGFLKPEISAPGRYIIGACPQAGTLCRTGGQNPALAPQGYLQLSGTSFSAPMVSGAAAAILALHPDWTPDLVKGQLMLTANALRSAVPGSVGVGELDVKDASDRVRALPPNPNLALDGFVVATPVGPVFDVASWSSAAQANASWSSASWSSASWSSASWSSASWSSASWSSASWSSASWSSASWSSAAAGLSFTNNASFDGYGDG